jgi:hypothetical protein
MEVTWTEVNDLGTARQKEVEQEQDNTSALYSGGFTNQHIKQL